VIGDGVAEPRLKRGVRSSRARELQRTVIKALVNRVEETAGDLGNGSRIEHKRAVLDAPPLRLDFLDESLDAELVDQDLDARLVDIVAPPELIVGAQHCFDIAQHVALGQERLDRLGEEWRAAEPAADHDLEAKLPALVAVHPQRQIVDTQRRAIVNRRTDRDLELARHEREFGVQRDVLADDLGPHPWIFDLVGRDAGPLIGGDVADHIAAGLHAVHADAGQVGHGVRQFGELDPVELDVLARGEVTIAAVVAPSDMREPAQLFRRQRAVGNGDAQHVGVKLQIDAVHQPQRLELFLGQLAGKTPRNLVTKLRNALGDEGPIESIVNVHARLECRPAPARLDAERHRQIDGRAAETDELA